MAKKPFSELSPLFTNSSQAPKEGAASTAAAVEARAACALAAQLATAFAAVGYLPKDVEVLADCVNRYEAAHASYLDARQARKRSSTLLRASILKSRRLRRRLLFAMRMLNLKGAFAATPGTLPRFPLRLASILAWCRETRESIGNAEGAVSDYVSDPLGQLEALAASLAAALAHRESWNRRLTACRVELQQAKQDMASHLAALRAAARLAFEDRPEVLHFFAASTPGAPRSEQEGAANQPTAAEPAAVKEGRVA